jgi:hypothetical protein
MKKRFVACVIFSMLVATVATAAVKWPADKVAAAIAEKDYTKIFTAYGAFDDDKDKTVNAAIEEFFTANRDATIAEVQLCLNGSKYSGKPKYGAIGAAEYLKALECLPAIEAAIPKETDWYIRCALAEALGAIDQETSKTLVVAQLEKEKDIYVAATLAKYLSRHPVPGTKEMLTKKLDYFNKMRFSKDASAFLAEIELKGALAALKVHESAQ